MKLGLIQLTCLVTSLTCNTTKSILDFLQEGDRTIKYSPGKNVVLILGVTGSGKTTLTQFISGNDNLISQEVGQDTGNYIIIDRDNKISSNSTITSKTIFPDLVLDLERNSIFYDCPGFSDTRSPLHDISANYFIKKIIDHSNGIKLVFTISYPSVREGVDRQGFMLLVKHATNLIKNVDKYRNSIILVVTKVDNIYVKKGKSVTLVPDEKIISSIVNFIQRVKEELNNKLEKPRNAIIFIESLLNHRIGIFRRPEESGKLSSIGSFQNSKKSLQSLVHEATNFEQVNQSDFGYTISEESKSFTQDLLREIHETRRLEIAKIGARIIEHYLSREKRSRDLQQLDNNLKSAVAILASVKDEFDLKRLETDLKLPISREILFRIFNQGYYLKFFESVAGISVSDASELTGLTNVEEFLANSQKWYTFLDGLYKLLSGYEIQCEKGKYKTDVYITNGKTTVNATNLEALTKKIGVSLSGIEYMEVDEEKLQKLKAVLDLTLNSKSEASCVGNKIILRGNFVFLSEILGIFCENVRFIEVFATDTVFVDKDFVKEHVQLSIIAPTWVVVGERSIKLDGSPGKTHNPVKASNGIGFSSRGRDGEPGLPGNSAGVFLGVGLAVKGENLCVSADGGRGGPGQDGGDGTNAKLGEDPPFYEREGNWWIWQQKWYVSAQWKRNGFIQKRVRRSNSNTYIETTYRGKKVYEVNGKLARDGGEGGNGGSGGLGGRKGNVYLYGPLKFRVSTKEGSSGADGNPGQGGIGAPHGKLLKVECTDHDYRLSFTTLCEEVESRSNGYSDSGKPGIAGFNTVYRKAPEAEIQIINPSFTINSYKAFLRKSLATTIKKSVLENFLNQLENDQGISSMYDTLGLVNDLQQLEDQFYELRDVLSRFYSSLLLRINKYSLNLKAKEKSLEYKKVLGYLYTATLSKICSIKNGAQSNLVIDLRAYLDFAVNDIGVLQKLNNQVIINKHHAEFKATLDEKILEVNNFVEKTTTEVNKIFGEIDHQMQLLVDETVSYQNASKEQLGQIAKKREKLQETLTLKSIMGPLNIISQALSFFGPAGAAFGAVSEGVTGLGSLLINDVDSKVQIIALPSSLVKISQNIRDKQLLFDRQLEDIEKQLVSGTMDDLKVKIKSIKRSNFTLEQINYERKEFERILDEKKKTLKNEKALRLINKFQNTIRIWDISLQFYEQIREDEGRMDEINQAMRNVEKQLDDLFKFETEIYNDLLPKSRDIENYLKSFKLQGKSPASLDVSKWKIQETLRDLKVYIKKIIKGFNVEENIVRCIEKLEEGMSIMIGLYNRIEDYQDRGKLVTFISDISSERANSIAVNSELKAAIDVLDLVIKSNIILGRFENVLAAFKQHVFPFAHYYLQEFNLPPSLRYSDGVRDLVLSATEKIQAMKSKIEESTITIGKYDKYIHRNIEFSSRNFQPFYVWKNSENKETIANLLSGQMVVLKADITKGFDHNAIKFNVIAIHLTNEKFQEELNRALESFQVTLVHLGTSYYRCGEKFYVITGENQTINYHFKKDDGVPVNKNLVYEKIQRNDPVLSPYTLWSIKLDSVQGLEGGVNVLEKFKNETIDLELEGRGQYLEKGVFNSVCDELDLYYQADVSVVKEEYSFPSENFKLLGGENFP